MLWAMLRVVTRASSRPVPVPDTALECPQATRSRSRLLATPSEACSPRHPPPCPRPVTALGVHSFIKRLFSAGQGLDCCKQAVWRAGAALQLWSADAPCGGFSSRAQTPRDVGSGGEARELSHDAHAY